MNDSDNGNYDNAGNPLLEAYRRLQQKAKNAQNQVNNQLARGGEHFMSPSDSKANADFITNQIGEGAVSGGVSSMAPVAGSGGILGGSAQELAEQVGGKEIAQNAGNGAIIHVSKTPPVLTEEATMAANANPKRIDPRQLLGIYKRFGGK